MDASRWPVRRVRGVLGGVYVIDVEDNDRAHEVAAMIPDTAVEGLGVEVRPIIFSEFTSK
ncbi:YciI family protein [Streptomyces klenkii]|uniref:YciI family protein n=1 Tax=Streptomyces klenkii TaxID=1420899 RepID=UPI00342EC601